jgi:hypothetical protein
MGTLHATTETIEDMRLVKCPDCGQLEWWSDDELLDHGLCRAMDHPCVVCAAP